MRSACFPARQTCLATTVFDLSTRQFYPMAEFSHSLDPLLSLSSFAGASAIRKRVRSPEQANRARPRRAGIVWIVPQRSRYVRWRTDLLVPTFYIETRSGKTHSRRADRMTNAFTGTIVGARTPRLGRFLHETRASPSAKSTFASARHLLRAWARGIGTSRARRRHSASTTASCGSGLRSISGRHPDRAGPPSCTLATAAPAPADPCGATGFAVRLLLQPLLPPLNGAESVQQRCLCVRHRTGGWLLHDHAGVETSVRCCP
jgi:hypothetical protein